MMRKKARKQTKRKSESALRHKQRQSLKLGGGSALGLGLLEGGDVVLKGSGGDALWALQGRACGGWVKVG